MQGFIMSFIHPLSREHLWAYKVTTNSHWANTTIGNKNQKAQTKLMTIIRL